MSPAAPRTESRPGVRSVTEPPTTCDVAVVGGGIVGLATARELLLRDPALRVCVLERERSLATHQTGHNSGVVHAGIYYKPGSLKARLCVEGARSLYEYCEAHGIEHRRRGKLIVATDPSELSRLDELERRGKANLVPGLRRLDGEAIADFEPHARGLAALHSPNTGVVDFASVARAFADDIVRADGAIATGCEVTGAVPGRSTLRLNHGRGATEARFAVFCAGAWSDRLAVSGGAARDPAIVPFRGAYLRLVPERRKLVRSLIYPVPDPSLPFLGVHLTRHLDGEVSIGPTALMAAARDAYSLRTVRALDLLDTLSWPGTWRMLGQWWRTGIGELGYALLHSRLVRAAARYVPELNPRDAIPYFAGVRAQALGRNGRLVDDFVLSATPRALHVRNAPSPAATSSLAIARHVVEEIERSLLF